MWGVVHMFLSTLLQEPGSIASHRQRSLPKIDPRDCGAKSSLDLQSLGWGDALANLNWQFPRTETQGSGAPLDFFSDRARFLLPRRARLFTIPLL